MNLVFFLDVLDHGGCGDGVIRPNPEQPRVPLTGQGGIRPADNGGDAIVLDRIGHGQDLGALDGADQRQNLLLLHGLLQRGQGAGVGGLVVHNDQVDFLAVNSTGCVDLLHSEFDRLDLKRAFVRRSAGDGRGKANLDRIGCLQAQDAEGHAHKEPQQSKRKPFTHDVPISDRYYFRSLRRV